MNDLHIALIQTDICWEDKERNLRHIRRQLEKLEGVAEIAVFAEMCTTGFSMNAPLLAEPTSGHTIQTLQAWAHELDIAVTGSYICQAAPDRYTNRAFFIEPQGTTHYYDKRHLFRMGQESDRYQAGQAPCIVTYKGWHIMLNVCYDLRFPVWSRNPDCSYDLLLNVANWPEARHHAWDILLQARAIENLCYVCGVNRIGTDGMCLNYHGGTACYNYKGEVIASVNDNEEGIALATLSLAQLNRFREKFPAYLDADAFEISSLSNNSR